MPRLAVALQPGTATYQAWLYESTGKIEFVYGSGLVTNLVNSGYSVGFGTAAAVFASVTTDRAKCLICHSQQVEYRCDRQWHQIHLYADNSGSSEWLRRYCNHADRHDPELDRCLVQ